MAAGEIDDAGFIELVASSAPSTGYCNTMGTATTMNSLAEALGMMLPGSAAIPAPYRDRQEVAYADGQAHRGAWSKEDLKPSQIMTREAFHECDRGQLRDRRLDQCADSPGRDRAPYRCRTALTDWQTYGHKVPLLVNLQPAGEYLSEDFYRAGGVPAVINSHAQQDLIHETALTVNGRTIGDNCRGVAIAARK